MGLVQVRDVPERTVEALKERTSERRLTLTAYLRAEFDRLAARPSNAEIVARMARRRRKGGLSLADTVAELHRIREGSVIVVEASAIVDVLVDDPVNPELLVLLAEQELHALALLDFEVASALRGHVLGNKLSSSDLSDAIADFAALTIERHAMTCSVMCWSCVTILPCTTSRTQFRPRL